jgi:DNA modification methylase
MSPYLAERVISTVTDGDALILDPMAGSGTVPAVALALSRSCYAVDIDPLARMIMKVRCGCYSRKELERAGDQVLTRACRLRRDYRSLDARFRRDFDEETQEFINDWFPLRVRRSLLALWDAICQAESKHARLPMKVAFSRTIIAKSAGTSYAIDLPHTRPHRDFTKEVPDPLEMFRRRLKELVRRIHDCRGSNDRPTLHVKSGDARRLPLSDNSVDLILTSSPYANAIDYMRAHKFSLVWMGYKLSSLRELRAQMIGTERGLVESAPELAWLDRWFPDSPLLASRVAILRRFFHDMDSVLAEMYRVLKPSGACVLVVGKSYVRGTLIDSPRILAEIARKRGFEHLGTVYRNLNHRRRSLPFPRSARPGQALGRRMAQEAVVALARR